jgi:hypothetical protein
VAPGRCAGIVAHVSWRQDLHDLEVGYVASSSTLMQGRNPRDRSTRVRHRSQLIVTTLLIDRSWAIRGCVSNIFFVISSEPQHIVHQVLHNIK